MAIVWTKELVVAEIFRRLNLIPSRQPFNQEALNFAVINLIPAIQAAHGNGIPISQPYVPIVEALGSLCRKKTISLYHIGKAIETHYQAHQAALALLQKVELMFITEAS